MTQSQVNLVPLTLPKANALVTQLHRHHAAIPGGFGWFCVGAVVDGHLVGCAIAGRPTNRNNDDGQTVEVLRVATDGTPNTPSALLGACARAAKAIGAARIITYTLDSESGVSLRGAGWTREADGIESWWTHPGKDGNGRAAAVDRPHMAARKVRWGLRFRDAVTYEVPAPPTSTSVDEQLFDVVPVDQSLSAGHAGPRLLVPVKDDQPLTGDGLNEPLAVVDADVQAMQGVQEVVRVGVAPSQVHNGSPYAGGAA